jgi:hypothetical protein
MFCPQCSQAFNAYGAHECPNCKFKLGGNNAPLKVGKNGKVIAEDRSVLGALEHPRVDAGVRKGLKLIFIAAGFFPVYLVLHSLYPANDGLVQGQRSADMFNTAGKAVLMTLALTGILRVAYAFVFERRAAMREQQEI